MNYCFKASLKFKYSFLKLSPKIQQFFYNFINIFFLIKFLISNPTKVDSKFCWNFEFLFFKFIVYPSKISSWLLTFLKYSETYHKSYKFFWYQETPYFLQGFCEHFQENVRKNSRKFKIWRITKYTCGNYEEFLTD